MLRQSEVDPAEFQIAPPYSAEEMIQVIRTRVETKFSSTKSAFQKFCGGWRPIDYQSFHTQCRYLIGYDYLDDGICQSAFNWFDEDGDGVISWEEFHSGVENLRSPAPPIRAPDWNVTPFCPPVLAQDALNLIYQKIHGRFSSIQEAFLSIKGNTDRKMTKLNFHEFLVDVGVRLESQDEVSLWRHIAGGKECVDMEQFKNMVIDSAMTHNLVLR
eukprot:Filipodium_phascolosomae@DN1720_c0_g1_i1.p1